MNSQSKRLFLGAIFAAIFFFLADLFIHLSEPGLQIAVKFAAIVAGGAVGIFLLPVATKFITDISATIAKRVASEVSNQLRLPPIQCWSILQP